MAPPSPDGHADPAWHLVLGLLAAALLLLTSGAASAQGLGSFLSPGPLAQDHADLEGITNCGQCHETGSGVSARLCLDCHDTVQAQIDARRGFHADLDDNCQSCHSDHKGRDFELVRFDEETFNHQRVGFALTGAHAPLECLECHEEDTWQGLDSECSTCHEEPHGRDESTRELLTDCRTCHDADDWLALPLAADLFDHDDPMDADFALIGQHAEVECVDCHDGFRFVPVAHANCTDCHDDVHRGQFGSRLCTECHDEHRAGFRIPDYDHDLTRYPLIGAHLDVSCAECHGGGPGAQYVGIEFARCDDCHEDVHDGQFAPQDCSACHSVELPGWLLTDFDHDETAFPLELAHEEVACAECHGEGEEAVYVGTAHASCEDCHEDPHEGRLGAGCEECHTDTQLDWTVAGFDHDQTAWPLTGAHIDADCAGCHGAGETHQLTGLAYASCQDCHAEENPHDAVVAADSCEDCHTTNDWAQQIFDHFRETEFALEQAHDLSCDSCHEASEGVAPAVFTGLESQCESCHAEDEPPNHFEGACADCHVPTDWRQATLGAGGHDETGFPLRGEHQFLSCTECHAPQEPWSNASPGCADCHGADDPHNNLLGDRCEDCHVEIDWLRIRFDHELAGWSLRGAHRIAACEDCHAAGFAGTPRACARCHEAEKPNDELHSDPLTRDCEVCHSPYLWEDATYPHGELP